MTTKLTGLGLLGPSGAGECNWPVAQSAMYHLLLFVRAGESSGICSSRFYFNGVNLLPALIDVYLRRVVDCHRIASKVAHLPKRAQE